MMVDMSMIVIKVLFVLFSPTTRKKTLNHGDDHKSFQSAWLNPNALFSQESTYHPSLHSLEPSTHPPVLLVVTPPNTFVKTTQTK